MATISKKNTYPVGLGLQGGGAHGAFTWGVLDALLEDGRLAIKGISGTSAGAMNGAALICGMEKGGPDGAREMLDNFWQQISKAAPSHSALLGGLPAGGHAGSAAARIPGGQGSLDYSPVYHFMESMTRLFSPYQFNPANWHPLRDVLEETLDFDCLNHEKSIDFFVTATNVRTGKGRIFRPGELTVDTLLASACLPQLYKAVEIDGEPYWDGGYMGNPSVTPLIECKAAKDVILVQINPIRTKRIPRSAREILNRVNEISFNSSLINEMRHISAITSLLDSGKLDPSCGARSVYLHMIEAEEVLSQLSYSSKLNAAWDFLTWLRDLGRERAGAWLEDVKDDLGNRSTVDLERLFL